MRIKLLLTTSLVALLAFAGLARAGVIPVLQATFDSPADQTSFTKVSGDKCTTKLRPLGNGGSLGINVGAGTGQCIYRTSVVSSSDDTNPAQDIEAAVGYEAKTPKNLLAKTALSVRARGNATGFYELRIIPTKQAWQVIRDPEGPGPSAVLKAGTAKFIRPGSGGVKSAPKKPSTPDKPAAPTKPPANSAQAKKKKKKAPKTDSKLNVLRLIVTPSGTGTNLVAQINGKTVLTTDDTAVDPPLGRFTEIAVGNKTAADASGMQGTFDDVTVRLP